MKWISVEDRLPPKKGNFLACNTRQMGLMYVAWFHNVHNIWKYTGGDVCGYLYEKPSFTHWQPLPAPPKEDTDE